jgi:hypothetical protein
LAAASSHRNGLGEAGNPLHLRPFALWSKSDPRQPPSPASCQGETPIIALAIILAFAPASDVAAFGAGARTCDSAFAGDRFPTSYAWVMGCFSGVNTASASKVGQTADGDAIMAEVQLQCQREPALRLIEAADRTYAAMRGDNR